MEERDFAKKIKEYIIQEAHREFGYAGLVETEDFAFINTGNNLTFEINVKKG